MGVALRLAASMVCLQASIGALNDLADAGADAGRKPGKPLPSGRASIGSARAIVAGGLLAGLLLSAPSGLPTVVVAAAGVASGYVYDLRASRTAWSWVPLAVGLPLLPIHAWLGATGSLPAVLPGLVPIGILAGAGLALANGLADHERDASAGTGTAVVRLGPMVAWRLHALTLAGAVALAVLLLPRGAGALSGWGMAAGCVLLGIGVALAASARQGVRERGWEAEAAGVALLGAAWLSAVPRT